MRINLLAYSVLLLSFTLATGISINAQTAPLNTRLMQLNSKKGNMLSWVETTDSHLQ
ncbi:hypothetical protein MTP09_10630 [Chryseobacterium suipulveris]|uniref:Uncharacterized protein n=1 Tax=Chryseobacterium suipulveris TaxID=2929800 RepID=A0ABY4BUX7_9FLAO|nr:hypothetical protein [Chryseobacterium suipulveris]UOE40360.1 hypothetical protein MTP09_10630 [Chryseobacterium suipulveris]